MKERIIVCGIVQRGDEVILGKKAKDVPPYVNVWHTPGGGVEDYDRAKILLLKNELDNDFFHEELKREMREELGVEVDNIECIIPEFRKDIRQAETVNKHNEMTHYYFLEYLCDYKGGNLKASDDLDEAKWIGKKDLKDISLTPPSLEMYKELGWISG